MSLRLRIVAAVLLVALVPLGVAAYGARRALRQAHRESATALHVARTREARARLTAELGRDRRSAEAECDGAPELAQAEAALVEGRPVAEVRAQLEPYVQALARVHALDVVWVAAEGPRLRVGGVDDATLAYARQAGDRTFFAEPDGHAALLTSCVVRGARSLRLVVGRAPRLDSAGDLERTADPAARDAAWVLRDATGTPVGALRVPLRGALSDAGAAELDPSWLFGAGGVALLLALASGAWLLRTVARPLRAIELAAARVGGGDLDSTATASLGGAPARGEGGRAVEAFDDMTKKLRQTQARLLRAERIAAWRDIARRIAHEIKNPLQPIRVSIETLRKTRQKNHPDFDEIFEESTVAVLEEVARMERIVTEFSRFARMPRPRAEQLDLREVVQHVVSLHQSGDVRIEAILPATLEPVRADREQLTQVVVNLVQNARDAAAARHGAEGRVELELRASADGVELCVRDDGPGIPPDQRAKVFEPYFTTKAGGTGLGLAIVGRIVTDHGGSVEIDDSPLGGAEVRVRLTREGPPREADASRSDGADLGRLTS